MVRMWGIVLLLLLLLLIVLNCWLCYLCFEWERQRTTKKKRKDILHIIYRQMNLNYDCAKYIYKRTHRERSRYRIPFWSGMEGGRGVSGSRDNRISRNAYSPLKQAEQHTEQKISCTSCRRVESSRVNILQENMGMHMVLKARKTQSSQWIIYFWRVQYNTLVI